MTPEMINAVLQGDVSIVAVCLIVIIGGYQLMVKHIIPGHKDDIDKLIRSADADRQQFYRALNSILDKLSGVKTEVDEIKEDVHSIKKDVSDIKHDLK